LANKAACAIRFKTHSRAGDERKIVRIGMACEGQLDSTSLMLPIALFRCAGDVEFNRAAPADLSKVPVAYEETQPSQAHLALLRWMLQKDILGQARLAKAIKDTFWIETVQV
jgi:hypothetical protein